MNAELVKGATVCNQMDWESTVDANRLSHIKPVSLGNRHHPVNHGDALDMFKNTLSKNHLPILNQHGLLSNDGLKYVYVADIHNENDYVMTNGFINFNDKTKSFTIILGDRVFICSNECFSHQISDLRRKHTGSVSEDLRGRMQVGVDRFLAFADIRRSEISHLKEIPFNENELGKVVLGFHRDGELSNTNIDRVINEFDNPSYPEFQERTAWNFQNSCTHVFKGITDPVRRLNMQKKMKTIIDQAIDITPIDE